MIRQIKIVRLHNALSIKSKGNALIRITFDDNIVNHLVTLGDVQRSLLPYLDVPDDYIIDPTKFKDIIIIS